MGGDRPRQGNAPEGAHLVGAIVLGIVADVAPDRPPSPRSTADVEEAPFAPWGVQLAGNFSKERALASFARARQRYAGVLGEARPMVIGTRLRSRGTRAFYRVRVPAESRKRRDAVLAHPHGRRRLRRAAELILEKSRSAIALTAENDQMQRSADRRDRVEGEADPPVSPQSRRHSSSTSDVAEVPAENDSPFRVFQGVTVSKQK